MANDDDDDGPIPDERCPACHCRCESDDCPCDLMRCMFCELSCYRYDGI